MSIGWDDICLKIKLVFTIIGREWEENSPINNLSGTGVGSIGGADGFGPCGVEVGPKIYKHIKAYSKGHSL